MNEKHEIVRAKHALGPDLNFTVKEAYNLLRTNLLYTFSDTDNKKCKIIGVTSSVPKEGKSYTAINLAYAFANDDKKVLLIDGDMRNPSLYDTLDLVKAPGLSNLLVDHEVKVLHKEVLHENLDAIMSGDIPPNPGEMLGSKNAKDVFKHYEALYDIIIVDLPPINVVSDAITVSKYLDGVVMVVRHNYSRKKDVNSALGQLNFVHAKVLGIVYNDFAKSRHHYGSYSHYGKYGNSYYGYYGYGNKVEEKKEEKEESKK